MRSTQTEAEETIVEVCDEVEKQDEHILQLQKQLKVAEVQMSTLIFQAKQKLYSIEREEDLIKYSHKITASSEVCAPLNWQQDDPRRPNPTDIEMRPFFQTYLRDKGRTFLFCCPLPFFQR